MRAAATAPEAAVEARIDQLPDPDTTIKLLMNSALRVWTRRSHREGVIKAQAHQSTDIRHLREYASSTSRDITTSTFSLLLTFFYKRPVRTRRLGVILAVFSSGFWFHLDQKSPSGLLN